MGSSTLQQGLRELLSHSRLRKRLLIMLVVWCCCSQVRGLQLCAGGGTALVSAVHATNEACCIWQIQAATGCGE